MSFQTPPPPPPGYGAPMPPVPNSGWSIGNALSYGWTKFQANVGQILLTALVLFVGIGVVYGVMFAITAAVGSDSFVLSLVLLSLTIGVVIVAAQLIGAGLIRGALDVTEGRPFLMSSAFKFADVGKVLVTALIIGGLSFVGFLLCYLPGVIVAFATSYAMYFVVDKNMEPVDAVKASVDLVRSRLGDTILWWLVAAVVGSIGGCLCGVGALVTYPIALIGTAYTYKHLTGQPVAP
ncbi:hypothetical protein [Nocardioides sp.]|uniref:hypothetical protein n=1 Tax=Nocardioides sp. TaxID=35761 RepID=UPI0035136D31